MRFSRNWRISLSTIIQVLIKPKKSPFNQRTIIQLTISKIHFKKIKAILTKIETSIKLMKKLTEEIMIRRLEEVTKAMTSKKKPLKIASLI